MRLSLGFNSYLEPAPVGAAEGCDLLILIFVALEGAKIKRSQPSAAPTGDGVDPTAEVI
jgi:hypothetical protein